MSSTEAVCTAVTAFVDDVTDALAAAAATCPEPSPTASGRMS